MVIPGFQVMEPGDGDIRTDEEVLARCASPVRICLSAKKGRMRIETRNKSGKPEPGRGLFSDSAGPIQSRNTIPVFSLIPTFFIRHRAAFRNVIAFPAAQGLATIVPAGGRPSIVDSTDPLQDPEVVRLLLRRCRQGASARKKPSASRRPRSRKYCTWWGLH